MSTEYRYLDILWIENFLMNYVLLWLTSKLSKHKSAIWRLCLSAAIGASYAVLLLLPGFEILQRFPLKIVLSLVILTAAFEFCTFKEFCKLLAFFYGITFVFGGAILGMYYFCSDMVVIDKGVLYIKNYPLKIFVVTCVSVVVLLNILGVLIRNRIFQEELFYKVRIQFGQEQIMLRALLDTGNALCDPLSLSPVIVVEFEKIQSIMPPEIRSIFRKSDTELDLKVVSQIISSSSWFNRFRVIPFTALGKPNGMLIGFRPDRVQVFVSEKWKEVRDVIIGIYSNRLTKNGEYNALMNPNVIS